MASTRKSSPMTASQKARIAVQTAGAKIKQLTTTANQKAKTAMTKSRGRG